MASVEVDGLRERENRLGVSESMRYELAPGDLVLGQIANASRNSIESAFAHRPTRRPHGEATKRYNFEILRETTSAIERNVPIADAGLWRRIGAIASFQNSGGMIKVTDEMGGIVALTTATYLCTASFLSDYMSP